MKKIFIKSLLFIMFISFGTLVFTAEFSKEDAKRVDAFLKKAKRLKRKNMFLRKMSFTEKEFNSYINLIYIKRYASEAKYVKINFERKNSVSGKVKLKLRGKKYQKIPSFLKDILLEFSGTIECKDYKMRLIFSKIIINGTEYNPQILDEAFSAYQVKQKVKKSMFDWFKLLPGLRNIQITKRRISIYY